VDFEEPLVEVNTVAHESLVEVKILWPMTPGHEPLVEVNTIVMSNRTKNNNRSSE
jgi:hypothetical protein